MNEQEIFHRALSLPPEARSVFLDHACEGDAGLRSSVAALLSAHEGASGFLDSPALGPRSENDLSMSDARIGGFIGNYRLVEQIGEGGMGTVYLADQKHPVRRQVALKVIKPGMDSRRVVARFEAERQALALMDHPNIARVLDAGTTELGRPYFVMEYVAGVPITRFCDETRLTIGDRLRLFVPVCEAIQHAHQKGIIHRDVKPTNVIVAASNGKPMPKVIDFGVAKAVEREMADHSLGTQFGQVVGTLEYMAPEQADSSSKGVDTRADVYSLGVLLYELLVGSTPLSRDRMEQRTYAELVRVIMELDPPTPSTRLSDSGESIASISAVRQTEPKKLAKLVRGELDWIVMRCLEKDRDRRYASANELAADLLRHLNDEPVHAGPPSRRYRLRKFVRRNKGFVLSSALILLSLIGGVVGTTWGMVEATAGRKEAEVARKAEKERADGETKAAEFAREREAELRAIVNFVTKRILAAARPKGVNDGLGKDVLLRDAMIAALPHLEKSFSGKPLIEATMRETLGNTLLELGLFSQASRLLEQAYAIRRDRAGPDALRTLITSVDLANALIKDGRAAEAVRLIKESEPRLRKTVGEEHDLTLSVRLEMAKALMGLDRASEALEIFRQVLPVVERVSGSSSKPHLDAKHNLAACFFKLSKHADAASLFEEVVAAYTNAGKRDDPSAIDAANALATTYAALGRRADALKLRERTTPKLLAIWPYDHPIALRAKLALGIDLLEADRASEATKYLEEAYADRRRLQPSTDPDTFWTLQFLLQSYWVQKRYPEGTKLLEEYLPLQHAAHVPEHSDRLSTADGLARFYSAAGRETDALRVRESSLAALQQSKPPNRKLVLQAKQKVATSLARLKRSADAVRLIDECLSPTDVKDLDPKLVSSLLETRIRHFLNVGNAAECRATAVLAESWAEKRAVVPYNAACFRALAAEAYLSEKKPVEAAADADKSMEWLAKAVATGLDKRIRPEQDPDLKVLREREDFKKLVASLTPPSTKSQVAVPPGSSRK